MRPHHLFVVFMLSVAGCREHPGIGSISETLPLQVGIATPVINEILFDPLKDSKDTIPDQTEFVEIYNPGTTPIDLTGWSIADRPAPVTRTYHRYYFAPAGGSNTIGPGQYAVIAPETGGIVATSRLVAYYTYLTGLTDVKIFLDSNHSTFDLNNDGDCVRLLDGRGAVVDSVNYTSLWHNPANKATKRISLEKLNPLLTSDSPLSWSSSADTEFGGTPGKVNSVYIPPSRSEEMLLLSPNPFSPNGDMRDDRLRITVNLPAGSYQLAVTIYDLLGAEVRRLASGTPAGPVALLFWDGSNDGGVLAPPGVYRVTMNASGFNGSRYSSTGNVTLAR
jgi:hypothetical protein